VLHRGAGALTTVMRHKTVWLESSVGSRRCGHSGAYLIHPCLGIGVNIERWKPDTQTSLLVRSAYLGLGRKAFKNDILERYHEVWCVGGNDTWFVCYVRATPFLALVQSQRSLGFCPSHPFEDHYVSWLNRYGVSFRDLFHRTTFIRAR